MNKDIDKILNKIAEEDSSELDYEPDNPTKNMQDFLYSLCGILSKKEESYNPEATVEYIEEHWKNEFNDMHISYSVFTSYIYELDEENIENYLERLKLLNDYAIREQIKIEYRKFIEKVFDHSNLAKRQLDLVKQMMEHSFEKQIEKSKKEIFVEIKSIQKEYIVILGIFTSIVMALMASMTFSSSVLENIGKSGPYRTLVMVLLIAFVTVNVMGMLFCYLNSIAEKNNEKIYKILKYTNYAVVFFSLVLSLCWWVGVIEMRNSLVNNKWPSKVEVKIDNKNDNNIIIKNKNSIFNDINNFK